MLSENRTFNLKGNLTLKKSRVLNPENQPKDDTVNWLFMEVGEQQFSFVYKIEKPLDAYWEMPFSAYFSLTVDEDPKTFIKLKHLYRVFRGEEYVGTIYITSFLDEALTDIYVRLLDEGTEVFRAVKAEPMIGGFFKILPNQNYNPENEKWEFVPGAVVKTEMKQIDGAERPLAVPVEDLKIIIDGDKIKNIDDFYAEILPYARQGAWPSDGSNLGAFDEIVGYSFNYTGNEELDVKEFIWLNSEKSKVALGETFDTIVDIFNGKNTVKFIQK